MVGHIIGLAVQVVHAWLKGVDQTSGVEEEALDAQEKPDDGWVRLNLDEAMKIANAACCRDIIRDDNGRFLYRIDTCSVIEVELQGIQQGLLFAQKLGSWKVVLESDSRIDISFIANIPSLTHPPVPLISRIQKCMQLDQVVRFRHLYREVN